jgi:hypothetical protein
MYDSSEGVRLAIDQLQSIVGRTITDAEENLIIPSEPNGDGVDHVAATLSGGELLDVVAMGLLDDVSLKSVHNLIGTSYARVVENISLSDRRKTEDQIDSILHLRPDVIVIAGGTNEGASRSVMKLVNSLRMALQLSPTGLRPSVLFVGNQALAEEVTVLLEPFAQVHVALNVRPSLEVEQLGPAEATFNEIFRKFHSKRVMGVEELDSWSGGHLIPTSTAFGRVIRFLSKAYDSVLGVDVGSSSTVVAASFGGDLKLNVFTNLGVGSGLSGLLEHAKLRDITRWLPVNIPDGYVLDYLYNKPLYPASLPATVEDLAIEHAMAREVIRRAMQLSEDKFPGNAKRSPVRGTIPWFEPILVGGSVIASAPTLAQSLMIILDALEPTGITRIILDQNALTSALGAAAAINPILAIQVLESNSFVHLGYAISPVGKARDGSSILRMKIVYDTGQENNVEIKYGSLRRIPLPAGRTAKLYLRPLQRFDVGLGGPGKGGRVNVIGGAFGIVIDARGRPLQLPSAPSERRERLNQWNQALQK